MYLTSKTSADSLSKSSMITLNKYYQSIEWLLSLLIEYRTHLIELNKIAEVQSLAIDERAMNEDIDVNYETLRRKKKHKRSIKLSYLSTIRFCRDDDMFKFLLQTRVVSSDWYKSSREHWHQNDVARNIIKTIFRNILVFQRVEIKMIIVKHRLSTILISSFVAWRIIVKRRSKITRYSKNHYRWHFFYIRLRNSTISSLNAWWSKWCCPILRSRQRNMNHSSLMPISWISHLSKKCLSIS